MKRELAITGLVGLMVLYALALALQQFTFNTRAADFERERWLIQASLLWGGIWYQAWSQRLLNRPAADAPAFASMGAANRMTLLRGWLIAATGGFLFMPQSLGVLGWMPAVLYSAAAILDRLDGFVARRCRQASLLGDYLDGVFDALGLLVAPVIAVGYGKVHWLYLLVSAAYYCFHLGLKWRRWRNKPVLPLQPSKLRRTLAGFQMGMIAVVLWPPFQAPVTIAFSIAFMIPTLIGFLFDWLVVSARLQPGSPYTGYILQRLRNTSQQFLQPLLRSITVALLLLLYWRSSFTPASLWEWLFLSAVLCTTALILLGLATRIGALALILLLAWHMPITLLDGWSYALFGCCTLNLLLGGGRLSLWQWDDVWVERQDGTP